MNGRFTSQIRALFVLSCLVTLTGFDNAPKPGQVIDEARAAGRDAASFPPADEDYFHDMDGAIALTPEEIKGRNMWLIVEWRQRPLLGRDDREHVWGFRPAQDRCLRPDQEDRSRLALELARFDQRTVL